MAKNTKLQRPFRRPVRQRGSHRQWLTQFSRVSVEPGSIDAIVVPTARPAAALQQAVLLAAVTRCTLVALCSKQSSADEVTLVAKELEVDCVAVDIDDVPRSVLPAFRCDEIVEAVGYGRDNDLSFKRNFGLLFAVLAGWKKVVFLDDDLWVPQADDLGRVGTLLDRFPTVGLKVEGFPDNSVVCHANREVGGFQETFVGGGALGVAIDRVDTFFPDIYNEDWFFLLGWLAQRGCAVVGFVRQDPYNPFKNRNRAVMEELGDCLAEGIYALLDDGGALREADEEYWKNFLADRYRLITNIRDSILKSDKQDWAKDQMANALLASAERCAAIEPDLCVRYLAAWESDIRTWRSFVADHLAAEGVPGVQRAIEVLGITDAATRIEWETPVELAELQ